MSDLVERLRSPRIESHWQLMMKAADEIERLRATVREWVAANAPGGWIDNMRAELENEQAKEIHSCHADCTRDGCVNRRLRAELADLKASREAYHQECRDIATEGVAHWKKIAEEREAELTAIKGQKVMPFAWFTEIEQYNYRQCFPSDRGAFPLYALPVADKEPVGNCCYGGQKPKSACASCGAWKPVADKDAEDALENCRLFAALHRKEEWAKTVLRFCSEGGAVGNVLRAAMAKGE